MDMAMQWEGVSKMGGNVSAMNSVYPASHAQVTLTN